MSASHPPSPLLRDASLMPSFSKDDRLLLGVPKKGRLAEKVAKLLEGAGVEYQRSNRLDVVDCTNLPITLVFLPASDIAKYVGDGNVDLGITGLDVLSETVAEGEVNEDHVEQVMDFDFGKCKLSLLTPVKDGVSDPRQLAGKRIVTSFPHLTRQFFEPLDAEMGTKTHITTVSGSVEAACTLRLAEAVVDLVETGATMKAAGLGVLTSLMTSTCIMIRSKRAKEGAEDGRATSCDEVCALLLKRIEGYVTATSYVMLQYNVQKEDVEACSQVTPGKRSPTVSELKASGWLGVQVLVKRKDCQNSMDLLLEKGATDILVFAITNSRM